MENNVNTTFFTPHQELQPYIESYLFYELKFSGSVTSPLSIYPVARTEMSFILDEYHRFHEVGVDKTDSYPLCFVGLLDHGRHFDVFPKKLVMVMFKPYGAFKLFGIPQRYFSNQATDVRLLFPEINSLTEQLREVAKQPDMVVARLEGWLLKRLLASEKTDVNSVAYACEQIQKSHGLIRIAELSKQVGVSETNLGVQFRDKVGFSAKAFSRIVRFNNVNSFIRKNNAVNWQELVYKFDFFDQNHFIKEFKRFYGCTPSQWHSGLSKFDP
ncbi:AraC family transcriptional regulator [Pedobacter foliorum]|uniref:helix-turn-helix domain-containing protein n=1 Tax=Pedobacter foliorum TaxID=2739058 RepID=UPI0015668AF9|nr:helix-turn-helix domain-containing protein [Pedobacter foliorum]NRF38406.1 AraC family transcriptional regulator [Pedobacter foliorum]